MAQFTFTDSEPRAYVGENGEPLTAQPGQTYELAVDPGDGRWTPASPVASTPGGATDVVATAEGSVTPSSGA
jgi:hypothetical protein